MLDAGAVTRAGCWRRDQRRVEGGPGPAGGGPEQEDRGRIRADDVYPECWRSIHKSDDGGDTRRASGHCMCDLHIHMYHYDRAEVVLTLLDQLDFKVMPLNRRLEWRIKGTATSVAVSSFELNQRELLLQLGIQT